MLDTLKVASAIELGRGAGMYESYVRGEAYLMLHEGKAGEFQKFREHWGLVGKLSGRVEEWRHARRFGLSVAPRFLWECLTNRTVAGFHPPPRRTERADFPH
jgi:hypothetical protein